MMRACFFAVFGYLCGSVLFARLFSAAMGKDILCSSKDGNPGTSNAFQYGGFFCGLLTLLGDLCKGFLPVWLFLRTEEPRPCCRWFWQRRYWDTPSRCFTASGAERASR